MTKTVKIDIINEKAERLLQDLELLELIRVHRDAPPSAINWADRYKGAMLKLEIGEIDRQLNQLRNEWE
ncbi:MAG: hypothetical protein LCH37_06040 [Bacteroidetes bacterium]|nr:hypothetical protein [Bacteroidota bacterium]